ncbi:MAG: hypothetical protein R3C03_00835 [Pirellulaceae bacterium]
MTIKKQLSKLLASLEKVSVEHEEIFDTLIREDLSDVIYCGFIQPSEDFEMPDSFDMLDDDDADEAIRKALEKFLREANAISEQNGWNAQDRLDAFQDVEVTTKGGLSYEEFFGHFDEL